MTTAEKAIDLLLEYVEARLMEITVARHTDAPIGPVPARSQEIKKELKGLAKIMRV